MKKDQIRYGNANLTSSVPLLLRIAAILGLELSNRPAVKRAVSMTATLDATDDGAPPFDSRWDGASIPAEHWHFHRNLLARYGVVLGVGEYSRIIADIKSGKALLVKERQRGQGIYSVNIMSAKERIYVLAHQRNIITAWPPDRKLNAIRRAIIAARARPETTAQKIAENQAVGAAVV